MENFPKVPFFVPPKWTFPCAMLSIRKNNASAKDVRNWFFKWTNQYSMTCYGLSTKKGIVFWVVLLVFPCCFPLIVPVSFSIILTRRLLGVDEGRWTVQATSGVGGSSQRTSANTFQGQGFDFNAKISPVEKSTNIDKTFIISSLFLPCFCISFLLNISLLLESTPAWFTIYPRFFLRVA